MYEALHVWIFCKNCNYIQCQAVFSKNRERIWQTRFWKISLIISARNNDSFVNLAIWFSYSSSMAVLSTHVWTSPARRGLRSTTSAEHTGYEQSVPVIRSFSAPPPDVSAIQIEWFSKFKVPPLDGSVKVSRLTRWLAFLQQVLSQEALWHN